MKLKKSELNVLKNHYADKISFEIVNSDTMEDPKKLMKRLDKLVKRFGKEPKLVKASKEYKEAYVKEVKPDDLTPSYEMAEEPLNGGGREGI